MTNKPFTQAAVATRTLVELPLQAHVVADRDYEHPTREGHLSWMLSRAIGFFESGATEKAYLWLGFVQGALATRGGISLIDLDLANRDDENVGSYTSADGGKSRSRMLKLLAGMALAGELEGPSKGWALFWLGGLAKGTPDPKSLELLDLIIDEKISFDEARQRDEARQSLKA